MAIRTVKLTVMLTEDEHELLGFLAAHHTSGRVSMSHVVREMLAAERRRVGAQVTAPRARRA